MLEQGAPTAADKRLIQDGIEELFWVAALKPTNIGVPMFRDEAHEYLEIAVLTAALRGDAKANRLAELIHRSIPYPLLLVAMQKNDVTISLAHKRWSQGETGKVVIEDLRCTAPFCPDSLKPLEVAFLDSMAVSSLPKGDMHALYQGWLDRLAALEAARITDAFALPSAGGGGPELQEGLDEHGRIERELVVLRARANKEKQINRRVELNVKIKRLENERSELAGRMAKK
jgi:hypothetical protein